MASANQLKAFLKAHLASDDDQFLSIAMQVAAHEAKLGHGRLAKELRDLIDQAKLSRKKRSAPTPLVKPRGDLSDLLTAIYPQLRLADLVVDGKLKGRLLRLIRENRQAHKIRSHGLVPRKKVLLIGPPGTGKTMSASVLAGELSLPLFVVRMDGLMTKFMGETAAKLRIVFDAIQETRGVYLFDEFDSIGARRGYSNDVGEVRRVLNSFLQFIELDDSNGLLIAATNHPQLLDRALLRRFDDVIEYSLPSDAEIVDIVKAIIAVFPTDQLDNAVVAEAATGLSQGDITRACEDAIKQAIISNHDVLSQDDLLEALADRRQTHYSNTPSESES